MHDEAGAYAALKVRQEISFANGTFADYESKFSSHVMVDSSTSLDNGANNLR